MIEVLFGMLVWLIIILILLVVVGGKVIKVLINILSNIFKNIKHVIEEKNLKKQEEIRQQELKKQEEMRQQELKKQEEIRQQELKKQEEMRQQELKKQGEIILQEFRKQEEIRQQELKKQEEYNKMLQHERKIQEVIWQQKELKRQEEKRKQEEFTKKFPELAKAKEEREERERQKKLLELEEARRSQYAQWQEDLKLGKIKIQRETPTQKINPIQRNNSNIKNSNLENPMSYIDTLHTGYEFEEYMAKLLKNLGYYNVEVTPGSGDKGVDVLAEKNEITYAFQCKLYSNNNVGPDAVQQVYTGKKYYKRDIRSSCNKQLLFARGKRIGK